MPLSWSLALLPLFSVGGVAKSQNSSQMNLSGSSSSLTSDASTKAGTISLRSYGIGGALLHKRILLMTRQNSRERSRERENRMAEERQEIEEMMREETGAVERRGRSRQQSNHGAQGDSGLMLQRVRAGRTGSHGVNPTGFPPGIPGLGPMGLSPLSQPLLMSPKPQESPIRTRLMSPFRILRERSQSSERPMAVKAHLISGEGTTEVEPSSPQDERQGQAEQRARRSVSPNPFLWLCRDRHTRRKTVWQRERTESSILLLSKNSKLEKNWAVNDYILNSLLERCRYISFWRHENQVLLREKSLVCTRGHRKVVWEEVFTVKKWILFAAATTNRKSFQFVLCVLPSISFLVGIMLWIPQCCNVAENSRKHF